MKQIIGLSAIVLILASCTARKTVSDSGNISHSEKKATDGNSLNSQSATPATPPMERKISAKP